jgi:hypothetical protein
VARAKRTQRAEARRRYRATNAVDESIEPEDAPAPATAANRSAGAGASRPSTTSVRMGMGAAFRTSFRPLNVREDLASLPWLATRTPALWVPLLLTIGGAIVTAVAGSNELVVGVIFVYLVMFPALGSLFIGGFLAPRASWLVGLIVGIVSATCYVALGSAKLLPVTFQAEFDVSPQAAVTTAFATSIAFGTFLGAAAAWYRRFLRYSSPNRGKTQASKPGQKKAGDGRTRTAGTSQKAPVKR